MGIAPQLKRRVKTRGVEELTEIMGKVTTIVGNRFSQVLNEAEEGTAGTA